MIDGSDYCGVYYLLLSEQVQTAHLLSYSCISHLLSFKMDETEA